VSEVPHSDDDRERLFALIDEGRKFVPEYLRDTYAMLMCAFPDTIPEEDYAYVLYILRERGMSDRSIGKVIAAVQSKVDFVDEAYYDTYIDASGDAPLAEEQIHDPQRLFGITRRLIPCGFSEWFQLST
jgi:hypothetical protein